MLNTNLAVGVFPAAFLFFGKSFVYSCYETTNIYYKPKMKLKNILMNCLRLGKVVAIVTFFALQASCEGNVDYVLKTEWLYQNQSSRDVTILVGDGNFVGDNVSIDIAAGGNYFYNIEFSSTTKNTNPLEIEPMYSWHGATIIVGEQSYWVDSDEGITDIKNYEVEKLGRNNFRFTYTFTDEILEQLKQQSE